jgi:hypothetical protein
MVAEKAAVRLGETTMSKETLLCIKDVIHKSSAYIPFLNL